jgi:hypothetical protein
VFRESRKQKNDLQFFKRFWKLLENRCPYAKYQCSPGKKSWLFECTGWCSIAAKKVKEKSLLKLVFPFLHPTFCNRICRKIVVVGFVSVMKD